MAEENNSERAQPQQMYFPRSLKEGADQGYPFIEFKITERIAPESVSIFLYQPPGMVVSDGATYTNFDMGLFQGIPGAAQSQGGDIVDAAKAIGANSSDLFALGLLSKEGAATSTGVESISTGTSIAALKKGIATNPYSRLQFGGVNIRTYEFAFKMAPEEEKETEMAKAIERTFRKFLYPKRAGSIALQYPPLFEITFYSNGQPNPYMPKIKPSYLTSLSSTFNESTNAMFKKTGAPLEISIALSFQEERSMVRDDLYENDETIEERNGWASWGE